MNWRLDTAAGPAGGADGLYRLVAYIKYLMTTCTFFAHLSFHFLSSLLHDLSRHMIHILSDWKMDGMAQGLCELGTLFPPNRLKRAITVDLHLMFSKVLAYLLTHNQCYMIVILQQCIQAPLVEALLTYGQILRVCSSEPFFLSLHLSFSCPHLLPFYKKIVHLLPRYFPTASTYLHFRIPNI